MNETRNKMCNKSEERYSPLLLLLLLLPLYPELSEFSLFIQLLFPAMLYGSSSSGIGKRGRLFTLIGRSTSTRKKRKKKIVKKLFLFRLI